MIGQPGSLEVLMADAMDALDQAKVARWAEPRWRADGVDWKRLEVRAVIDGSAQWPGRKESDPGVLVIIKGARPEAVEFHYFVCDVLTVKGWQGVEVITEW